MRRIDAFFLVCVAGMAALFGALTLAETARALRWDAGGEAPDGVAGRPRDVDMEKLRRRIRQGELSDREALFFTRPAAPGGAAPAPAGMRMASRRLRVMDTPAEIRIVLPEARAAFETHALGAAEEALRRAEALLSADDEGSEIFRLNAAGAGPVLLSEPVVRLLKVSRRLHLRTEGAFDVTCLPLVELWRRAGEEGRLPEPAELSGARGRSSWDLLELAADGAVKKGAGVRVDLGGIARGYAVDRAIEELRIAGVEGALVDAGGDLGVFGRTPEGGPWRIAVPHPFRAGASCARLAVPSGAVCTSGGSRRLDPVLDPRHGSPAEGARLATVAAERAVEAGAWATALRALGPAGLDLLPRGAGIEAMVISGPPEAPRVDMTPGFRAFLESGPDF